MTQSCKRYPESVTKQMELSAKGLFNEAKLQNSKGYAESLDFLPALGLFKKESLQLEVN